MSEQIKVRWGGAERTVTLTPVAAASLTVEGRLGKHIRITRATSGAGVAWVSNGPAEVHGMRADGETVQAALDVLAARVEILSAWTKGALCREPQGECAACGTRIRTRRPDGVVRCRCGASKAA